MDKGALSDLCTICHSETPKYRCPRCKTQTCSLACYKRHQQRASCSGKRDPTTYVKKSQWATPAGVDHDYNYLKTVERSIDGASEESRERGIGVATTPSSRGAARAWQAGSGLQKYLRDNNITVEHAPLGMSRQKANQTRITKKGNVIWTVEWVDADGQRRLQPECSGLMSIEELYKAISAESRRTTKRRRKEGDLSTQPLGRVSKRRAGGVGAGGSEGDQAAAHQSQTPDVHTSRDAVRPDQPQVNHDGEPSSTEVSTQSPTDGKEAKADASEDEESDDSMSAVRIKPDKHFYLLKPGTASKLHVLIPLDSLTTLTTTLRNRTVQEYPTIYALRQPPLALTASFLLESEYLKTLPAQQNHSSVDAVGDKANAHGTQAQPGDAAEEEQQLDAKSILDMLKRDVTI